jgi:Arc/MetJ-type ribon-helix-helix transcriptional regulator
MKLIQVELPDEVAKELGAMVQAGWFHSEGEAVRLALLEFVRRHRLDLLERFQREDIEWALSQKSVNR